MAPNRFSEGGRRNKVFEEMEQYSPGDSSVFDLLRLPCIGKTALFSWGSLCHVAESHQTNAQTGIMQSNAHLTVYALPY